MQLISVSFKLFNETVDNIYNLKVIKLKSKQISSFEIFSKSKTCICSKLLKIKTHKNKVSNLV